MTEALISIDALAKAYLGVPALKNASLSLMPGEVHALMGENGAGKSTLIKILAGATRADSGRISLSGQPLVIGSPQDAARTGFRFIHQELSVIPQLSVAENLFLGRPYPLRLGFLADWAELNRRASQALAALAIDHIDPKRKIARLSTGDQMLVKIAAAFLDEGGAGARLYVMDEPTAALTDSESERLFAVIERLKAAGAAILYVSHRMDEVMRLAERITVMRDGKTVASLETSRTDKAEIIGLMTGRALAEAFPARLAAPLPEPVLTVEKLSGGAGHALSFTLRRGEILGITGLAGAGQSDALRLIMGAMRPSAGSIRFKDRLLSFAEPADRWQQGVAYVPRERRREGLIATGSIADNTVLPHLRSLARAGILRNRTRENARSLDLGRRVRLKSEGPAQPVYQLSGGNQQKVVFARAILAQPQILLLDEPSRGVDVGAKYDIHSLLRELTAAGASAILASTDLPELIGMTDRILVLHQSLPPRIVETASVTQQSLLSLIFGDTAEPASKGA